MNRTSPPVDCPWCGKPVVTLSVVERDGSIVAECACGCPIKVGP